MSQLTSIDDLLHHEPEAPPAEGSERGPVARFARLVGGAAVVAGLLWGALDLARYRSPYWLLFAGSLAVLLLRRLVATVAPPPRMRGHAVRRADTAGEGLYRFGVLDPLRSAVSRWENRLEWSAADAQRTVRILQPELVELIDERLRQRHMITRQSNPEQARALLGEQLWTLVSQPLPRPLSPLQLAAMVSAMEDL